MVGMRDFFFLSAEILIMWGVCKSVPDQFNVAHFIEVILLYSSGL